MDRFDRIFELHKILNQYRLPVSRKILEDKLECSRATVNRIIQDMRDFVGAPVKYDRKRNGYYYDQSDGAPYELPGLWFNASEIFALLTTQRLLAEVQPGLLEPHIQPLQNRLNRILANKKTGSEEIARRIKILQTTPRPTDLLVFRKLSDALLTRKRIKMLYHGRERDQTTERWVSPQRLVYYRDNWYLDGWCHLRKSLRSFSVDRIHVICKGEKARNIADPALDKHFTGTYGIFAGKPRHQAVIRFSGHAAKWVADEHWHSSQKSKHLSDGGLEIRVPYNDPRELIMDILKYGPDAEVLKPASLRRSITEKIRQTGEHYKI